jgi:fumarate hydratase class II
MLSDDLERIEAALPGVYRLALGGTAVGTGINSAPPPPRPRSRRARAAPQRSGKPITPKERRRGENVVDLMDALRKSVGGAAADTKAPKKGAAFPPPRGG